MSAKILPHGNPNSPVWVIAERPYDKDAKKVISTVVVTGLYLTGLGAMLELESSHSFQSLMILLAVVFSFLIVIKYF